MDDIQSSETTPVVQLAEMPVAPQPHRSSLAGGFDKTKLILPVSILIAGLMVSGAVIYSRDAGTGQNALVGGQPKVEIKKVDIEVKNAPMLGDANAPITIVEYGDFQCPFCQRYNQNVQSALVSEYVNTGKAKFIWKDYAFLGQESLWAAEAARCANDQGKFWQYHDYTYTHQGQENSGAFSKLNLKKFAQALGLNMAQFNNCLDSGKYTAFIQQETQQGSTYGVSGTPATFVNGRLVADANGNSVGAAPFSVFKSVIDQELSK